MKTRHRFLQILTQIDYIIYGKQRKIVSEDSIAWEIKLTQKSCCSLSRWAKSSNGIVQFATKSSGGIAASWNTVNPMFLAFVTSCIKISFQAGSNVFGLVVERSANEIYWITSRCYCLLIKMNIKIGVSTLLIRISNVRLFFRIFDIVFIENMKMVQWWFSFNERLVQFSGFYLF